MSAVIRARLVQAASAAAAILLAAGTVAPVQAAVAHAQARSAQSASDQARQTRNPGQRVCVVYSPTTGSRIGERVCKTRAQWEREGGIPDAE